MRTIFGVLERIAPTDGTVLLEGETGTGKDVLARAIHLASPRAKQPFVVVDCGAISYNLIESELFGHERGAFTGAVASRHGAFEHADGGTLFLDEIGELPIDVQPKLLRVLETREFRRVGGNKTLRADVRVVAATKRDLKREVERGKFREDLYFRLAVVPVTVPRCARGARTSAARPPLSCSRARRTTPRSARSRWPTTRSRRSRRTIGPATCASCATCSSARSTWRAPPASARSADHAARPRPIAAPTSTPSSRAAATARRAPGSRPISSAATSSGCSPPRRQHQRRRARSADGSKVPLRSRQKTWHSWQRRRRQGELTLTSPCAPFSSEHRTWPSPRCEPWPASPRSWRRLPAGPPAGRGLKPQASAVKVRAVELGLPVVQPTKMRTPEFAAWVASARRRGPRARLRANSAARRALCARRGCLNLHASILPR